MIGTPVGIALAVAAALGAPGFAQGPPSTPSVGIDAAAVPDSQRALAALDAAVRADPRNADAWHRRGMLAWALARRASEQPEVRGLDPTRLRRLADTSLRIAASLAPTSATIQLATGEFFRDVANQPTVRLGALQFLEAAVSAARAASDSTLWARAAIETGRVRWLQYDVLVDRMDRCPDLAHNLDAANPGVASPSSAQIAKNLHNQLRDCVPPPTDMGMGAYAQAEAFFRDALRVRPADLRAFRHVAMLLAERRRWGELEQVARQQIATTPDASVAWLALGLAQHRLGTTAPDATFDSALARIDPRERARLLSLTRVLAQPDSAAYVGATDEQRAAREQAYWLLADPLWSLPGNVARSEYLARVTFAELRWTVEELAILGADSDRGRMHIRYGPPDFVAVQRGCDFVPDPGACATGPDWEGNAHMLLSMRGVPPRDAVVTYWDYDNGLTVVFWGSPSYGTAYFPVADGGHIDRLVSDRPAAFDNVRFETMLELPAWYARFRAPGDSVELLLSARAPVAELRDAAGTNGRVRANLWLLPRELPQGYQFARDVADAEQFVTVIPPATYMYRLEATIDGAMAAARAIGWFVAGRDSSTGFDVRGFGTSDLLLATGVASQTTSPERWSDLRATPLHGPIAERGVLDVVWENYNLATADGRVRYAVSLTLQRERSAAGRVAATLLGALGEIAGVDRRNDRVEFRFEREAAGGAFAAVDHVAIDLADTAPGEYRLTVEITDRQTGRRASTMRRLTIGG